MKLIQKIAAGYIRTKFRLLSSISKRKAAQQAFILFCTPQSRTRNVLPAIFENAEKLSFQFRQYSIVGYRWNNGGGRRALIVHGFESSVTNFEKFVAPLIEKNYEVLAFDGPAHGRSTGTYINALIYRDFIKDIGQNYGPFHSYIAHSFGGLALCMALVESEQDESAKLVLIAPATESTTAATQLFNFLQITDREVKKEFENIIIEMSGHPLSWFSVSRTLPLLKASILWVHDENDPVTPFSDVEKIRNTHDSNTQFLITKGLGHSRIYRDPEVGRTIVKFV